MKPSPATRTTICQYVIRYKASQMLNSLYVNNLFLFREFCIYTCTQDHKSENIAMNYLDLFVALV